MLALIVGQSLLIFKLLTDTFDDAVYSFVGRERAGYPSASFSGAYDSQEFRFPGWG